MIGVAGGKNIFGCWIWRAGTALDSLPSPAHSAPPLPPTANWDKCGMHLIGALRIIILIQIQIQIQSHADSTSELAYVMHLPPPSTLHWIGVPTLVVPYTVQT